jgi:serine/threonine-protein kinase HipA
LAPAFDLNPFPDKDQELKTWLTPESGPVSSIEELVVTATDFRLQRL